MSTLSDPGSFEESETELLSLTVLQFEIVPAMFLTEPTL